MAKTVLIVEDDNFLQSLEAKKMTKEGYEVLTANNGEEALALFAKNVHVDMVLLDLMLPGIDGFGVLEKMREETKTAKTPVIVFSNLSEEKDIKKANELGISEFMVKSNFTLDQLAERVKSLVS